MSEKLVSEADELAKEAEQKNKSSLIGKSNALRKKSHGKRNGKNEKCEKLYEEVEHV
ncbi:hypothetical protein DPMN_101994 [Dreissena polymorpha]|uniref:Uncharacterized protein n=1 Tax=Dreissena polymorpha TaxID=45954 RepID=A0A9D4R8T3_DREPO|nr:hypothetical protein DPMN_101994 [Dreissena polymorpha]